MHRLAADVLCPRMSVVCLGAGILLVVAGCGSGRIATYPVTGMVLVDGRPADGAMVVFVPTSTDPRAERKRPYGIGDVQGRFQLTTFEKDDGAPAGEYKVLVQWPVPSEQFNEQRGSRRGSLGPDRLRGRYFNLETATLTATVGEKPNDLPPFELKSR